MPRRPSPSERPLNDPARGERLQRVMNDAGVGSRRACEQLIEDGLVEVNGDIVQGLPAFVDPATDRIVVEGRPLPKPERLLYIMLNKPARVLTSAKDEPGADRRTVVDLVDHPAKAKLVPVGRLDYDTLGLVILTNDGELANRLTHPRYGVPKTYRVVVKGQLSEEEVAKLEEGIYLAERRSGQTVGAKRTARVELRVHRAEATRTVLDLVLREGQNRQVRRMMAAVGHPVRRLERVAMGPVRLRGVARGAWRELTATEISQLKRAAAKPPGGAAKPPGGAAKRKPAAGTSQRTNQKPGQESGRKTSKGAGRTPAQEPGSGTRKKTSRAPGNKPSARRAPESGSDSGPAARRASGPGDRQRTEQRSNEPRGRGAAPTRGRRSDTARPTRRPSNQKGRSR